MNSTTVRIYNARTNQEIASAALIASSFFARLKGLLGKTELKSNEALILPNCQMVHMFFMRFAIDLVFCSNTYEVVGLQAQLQPWKVSRCYGTAYYVIELPSGSISVHDIRLKDVIKIIESGENL